MEDKELLKSMNKDFYQYNSNSWVAPLPFCASRKKLPKNVQYAEACFTSLQCTLCRKPEIKKKKKKHLLTLCRRCLQEPVPAPKKREACWYLPWFGMYNPHKLDQIKVVFDSRAQYGGVSLNDVLLTGPNVNDNLIEIY